ncbi:MAG: hypothetical protein ACC660_06990 [Acidimicrobiales bacterium]
MKRIPTRYFRGPAAALAVGTVLLAGCASSGPQLDASVDTLVEFESEWQCDVTRFSFASPTDIDDKRDEIRARYGVSAEDHGIFVTMLSNDADLRELVATQVDTTCPVPSN